MSTFHLQIVTPEKLVFDSDVEKIVLRTNEGDIGILKGHISYLCAISAGPLKIKTHDASERFAALSGGFVNVKKDKTIILANTCEWADEIDVERAQRSKERAEDIIKAKKSKHELDLAKVRLEKAITRISVAENK